MTGGVLNRYLMREGAASWLAVTGVLLAIMLSTRFIRFLSMAAAGELPRQLLLKVVGLSALHYLLILIPVSLLLGVMLALGRLYKDQEISAMTACGVGLGGLYRPFIGLALALAGLTALLSFQIGPWSGRIVDQLVKDSRRLVQFAPFEPGAFKDLGDGRATFYTQSMSGDAGELENIFVRVDDPEYSGVITAHAGEQDIDSESGERKITLTDGQRYVGTPGRADYEIMRFKRFGMRVQPPDVLYVAGKRKLATTSTLLASGEPEDLAELHWRISAPIAVLILVLLAVPLSHASPRSGRYGKIVLGILVYLVYSNLLAMGQVGIADGKIPSALGLWWVHAIFLVLALALIAQRAGWFARRRAS